MDISFCSFCAFHQGQLSTRPRSVDVISLAAADWHVLVLHTI